MINPKKKKKRRPKGEKKILEKNAVHSIDIVEIERKILKCKHSQHCPSYFISSH